MTEIGTFPGLVDFTKLWCLVPVNGALSRAIQVS